MHHDSCSGTARDTCNLRLSSAHRRSLINVGGLIGSINIPDRMGMVRSVRGADEACKAENGVFVGAGDFILSAIAMVGRYLIFRRYDVGTVAITM